MRACRHRVGPVLVAEAKAEPAIRVRGEHATDLPGKVVDVQRAGAGIRNILPANLAIRVDTAVDLVVEPVAHRIAAGRADPEAATGGLLAVRAEGIAEHGEFVAGLELSKLFDGGQVLIAGPIRSQRSGCEAGDAGTAGLGERHADLCDSGIANLVEHVRRNADAGGLGKVLPGEPEYPGLPLRDWHAGDPAAGDLPQPAQATQPAEAATGRLDARQRPKVHKEQLRHHSQRPYGIKLLGQYVLGAVDRMYLQVRLVIQPELGAGGVPQHGHTGCNDRGQVPAARRLQLEDVVGKLLFDADARQNDPALLRAEGRETGIEPRLVLLILESRGLSDRRCSARSRGWSGPSAGMPWRWRSEGTRQAPPSPYGIEETEATPAQLRWTVARQPRQDE